MRLLHRFADWLRSWWRREDPPFATVRTEELPDRLEPRHVYVLGEGANRWFVARACPCGCGELIQLSVMEGRRPRWELTENADGTVSVHPSVWRTEGCRSHFFLRRGRVEWCRTGERGSFV